MERRGEERRGARNWVDKKKGQAYESGNCKQRGTPRDMTEQRGRTLSESSLERSREVVLDPVFLSSFLVVAASSLTEVSSVLRASSARSNLSLAFSRSLHLCSLTPISRRSCAASELPELGPIPPGAMLMREFAKLYECVCVCVRVF